MPTWNGTREIPSSPAVPAAPDRDLQRERGTLEQVTLAAHAFEAITLWDVLEHVSAPPATLQRVRNWLAPEGWPFLSMPNPASYRRG